ncbi:DUF4239 domain-containing protein [Aureimonas fodinaquatilis]|uniref:DUF4239 domain-containing protein n=1 Tax=Aureimonas fodinaquatilis TaxID=2565783 RepID=A0A5B0DZ18_9HYPH|nr:DUF4239 domain-containing protein [Aureimonas fodinaquatilis]KAA0970780.1 DUF4239 domain-containing protein [Aureimonas fodinaquatilis]
MSAGVPTQSSVQEQSEFMLTLLSLPQTALIIAIFVFVATMAGVALLILAVGQRLPAYRYLLIPAPPFIGVIATMWALALGFAASDLWVLANKADQALTTERSAIIRLADLASPGALNWAELRDEISNYVGAVEKHEHARSDLDAGHEEVDQTLQNILQIAIHPPMIVSSIAELKLVGALDDLHEARSQRLAVNKSAIDASKWYLMFSLSFLTMITIALVHLDKPVAGYSAIAIYSIACLAGFWILVVHLDPLSDTRPNFLSQHLSEARPTDGLWNRTG